MGFIQLNILILKMFRIFILKQKWGFSTIFEGKYASKDFAYYWGIITKKKIYKVMGLMNERVAIMSNEQFYWRL